MHDMQSVIPEHNSIMVHIYIWYVYVLGLMYQIHHCVWQHGGVGGTTSVICGVCWCVWMCMYLIGLGGCVSAHLQSLLFNFLSDLQQSSWFVIEVRKEGARKRWLFLHITSRPYWTRSTLWCTSHRDILVGTLMWCQAIDHETRSDISTCLNVKW